MEIHVLLRQLVATVGLGVLSEPDDFEAALDDYLPDDAASPGELNLVVDAVRLGAYKHLMRLVDDGAAPADAVTEAGLRLANVRGSTDLHGASWACALLGYAAGVVPEAEVRRRATLATQQALRPDDAASQGASPDVTTPRAHSTGVERGIAATTARDPTSPDSDRQDPGTPPHVATSGSDQEQISSGQEPGRRSRTTSSRRAASYALAMVAITLLTILVVDSYGDRQRGEAIDASPDDQPTATAAQSGLQATMVFVPDFEPLTPSVFMMPDGETTPPNLPDDRRASPAITSTGSTRYNAWHERNGGIPLDHQTVRLVLAGSGAGPVVVTRIQPVVLQRERPVKGWMFLPEVGSGILVRYAEASLDCPERPATFFVPDPQTGELMSRTSRVDLEVSRTEVEEVELTVYTTSSYVRWGLRISYVIPGDGSQTMQLSDRRMRVTGFRSGSIRTYTYFPSELGTGRPGRTGLTRTPQYDLTTQDARDLARHSRKLCT